MASARVFEGDCIDGLHGLAAQTVQTCITSPPYYGLRDYGHADQIGLEETPELYAAELVAVFREVRRVLRDDGTLWLNLGDSYYSPTATQGRNENRSATSTLADHGTDGRSPALDVQTSSTYRRDIPGLKPKDLLGIRTMTVPEIAALGVSDMAEDAAHLYLWTTQRYLWDARTVVEAWGFKPSAVLTWCKPPMGSALGFAFAPTSEFVVFGHRGGLKPTERHESTWFAAARPYIGKGGPTHSAKPDVFLDIVERVSPGPYLELFARRARFGWHYWGDQSLNTAEEAA